MSDGGRARAGKKYSLISTGISNAIITAIATKAGLIMPANQ